MNVLKVKRDPNTNETTVLPSAKRMKHDTSEICKMCGFLTGQIIDLENDIHRLRQELASLKRRHNESQQNNVKENSMGDVSIESLCE